MRNIVAAGILICSACYLQAQDEDVLRPYGRTVQFDSSGNSISRKPNSTNGSWVIGPELGLNVNFFSSNINNAVSTSPYQTFKTGSGISGFGGAYVEYAFTRSIGVGGRFLYDVKHINNSFNGRMDCPDIITGEVPVTDIETSFEETVSYITLNPLLRWSPIEQLIVHIGPVAQFAVGNITNTTTTKLPADGTCQFNFGTDSATTSQSATTESAAQISSRFGVDLGVGYRIPIAPSIALVPRIGYQWILTKYGNDSQLLDESRRQTLGSQQISQTDLTLTSLQASISLWFTL